MSRESMVVGEHEPREQTLSMTREEQTSYKHDPACPGHDDQHRAVLAMLNFHVKAPPDGFRDCPIAILVINREQKTHRVARLR